MHNSYKILFSKTTLFFTMIVFVLSLLFLFPSYGNAQEKQVVRVGWYYYEGMQEGANPENLSGYNFEYLQKIAQYTGWEYQYIFSDLESCLEMLDDGKLDLIGFVSKTKERENQYLFSKYPAGEGSLYLLAPSDTTDSLKMEDLDHAVVASVPSSYRKKELDSIAKEYGITFDYVYYDTTEACIYAMNAGKSDLVLTSSLARFSDCQIVYKTEEQEFYFMLNSKETDLHKSLNNAMQEILLTDSKYNDVLFSKYYSSPSYSNEMNYSNSEKEYIKNAPPVRVAVCENNYPMNFIGKDGEHHGFIYQFLNLLSDKTGLSFDIQYYKNYSEAIRSVQTAKADIMLQLPNDIYFANNRDLFLTQSFLSTQRGLLYKTGKKISTIAAERGQFAPSSLISSGDYSYIYFDDIDTCIKAVENNRADAALVTLYTYELLRNYQNTDFSYQILLGYDMNYSIGINKNCDPFLYSVLEKAIGSTDPATTLSILSSVTEQPKEGIRHWIHNNRSVLFGLLAVILTFTLFFVIYFVSKITHMQNETQAVLTAKNKELEKANAAKSDFLSRTSHDLRTPMNAIIGLTALALDEPSNVEKDFYLSQIATSSQFLLELINDVLDMDKIENGAIQLNPEPYAFSDFKQMIKNMISPLCREKHIDFIFENFQVEDTIVVDKNRFNQIFFNLLSNAVKYTKSGGTITFSINCSGTHDEIAEMDFMVADTGIGMSKEFMEHMYEPFSQEYRRDDMKGQGSGLGLAIVKNMVDLMNGTIAVESHPNEGTIFLIHLSLPTSKSKVKEKTYIDPNDIDRVLSDTNILLVDDQPLNLEVSKKLLEKKHVNVTLANDGAEAFDIFKRSDIGHFDAILMDIRMPNMNGLEASRAIRSLDRKDADIIPIIAMTANTFDEDKEKSCAAGMDAHLGKPIIPKELFECLYEWLYH